MLFSKTFMALWGSKLDKHKYVFLSSINALKTFSMFSLALRAEFIQSAPLPRLSPTAYCAAHPLHSTSACSITSSVAACCRSGG